MNKSIMKSAVRVARVFGLPALFAIAFSGCVAYPVYDSGYAYSPGYGYDYGYTPAPVYGSAYVGSYWSSPTYVSPGPTIIVRDHDRYVQSGHRYPSRGWASHDNAYSQGQWHGNRGATQWSQRGAQRATDGEHRHWAPRNGAGNRGQWRDTADRTWGGQRGNAGAMQRPARPPRAAGGADHGGRTHGSTH